jgi:cell division protein FtsI (penicillin-binding protein 3)
LAQGLRDARGNVLYSDGVGSHDASMGGAVVSTIDLTVQEIVERELRRAVTESGAKAGTAVVTDPATGEVLAMANVPDFNPNVYAKARPSEWRNRAVTDCYEPGSTMKVFTMAAALQNNVVGLNERIDCQQGRLELGGHVINDTHSEKSWLLTAKEILVHSSNVGAAKIGLRLGKERLFQALNRFGFGAKTGIDVPGETGCVVRPAAKWSDVGTATVSFGQGISVTPLQLIAAVGAVANGGVWMRPLVVREIRDPKDQVIQKFEPQPSGRVLDGTTINTLTKMMVAVTETGGTGTAAAVPGFQVAGKTGTAQKVDPIIGGYSKDKRVASFVGFIPADKPRICVLVVVDEPATSPYGGVVAAPVFARIAEATLAYLGVFPDLPPVRPQPNEVAEQDAKEEVSVVAMVENADPAHEASSDGSFGIPDTRGFSAREALSMLSQKGLETDLVGSGKVVRQQPSPGSQVRLPAKVSLMLEINGMRADGTQE